MVNSELPFNNITSSVGAALKKIRLTTVNDNAAPMELVVAVYLISTRIAARWA